jgi:hypothetical protein
MPLRYSNSRSDATPFCMSRGEMVGRYSAWGGGPVDVAAGQQDWSQMGNRAEASGKLHRFGLTTAHLKREKGRNMMINAHRLRLPAGITPLLA